MTIAVVQHDAAKQDIGGPWGSLTLAWPSTPTAGNALFLFAEIGETGFNQVHMVEPSGWTVLHHVAVNDMDVLVARRVSDGTETGVTVNFEEDTTDPGFVDKTAVALVEVNGTYEDIAVTRTLSGNPWSIPTVTPTGGIEALLLALTCAGNAYGISDTPDAYTALDEVVPNPGTSERFSTWYRHINSTSGSYSDSLQYGGGIDRYAGVNIWLSELVGIVADFSGVPTSGVVPLTVAFTDLSSGGDVTAWDWDFGDGGTSTSQNPSHQYTVVGTYTVTLVVTIDGADYTVTKTSYVHAAEDVGYVPPEPGRAILEIKATSPGADRWDEANWDEGRWSSTSWQDVTPYAIEVQIQWGSDRPEFGILSTPNAATWAISFYDPDRVLDPANEDSPYAHDLQPLLPVRLRHNEKIIKQGFLETGSHRYSDGTGYWRVMDIQAVLANAVVPEDTTLSDTLFSRTRDAIAAAGLSVTVVDIPAFGDPALAPWTSEQRTAWEWITDAAQQVLWVPYVRNDNTLGFRDYRNPSNRGRVIGSPNLEDLQSVTAHNGLFSIIGALELVSEGPDIIRRELTPKPRYGAREYLRTEPTPDSGDWAQAVLDDRAVAALRWEPGRVVPFTASETAYFADLQAIEQISIYYPEAVPPIVADGIVVGGTIHVIGKKDAAALWDFTYNIAQIATQPLVDDSDVSSYLVRDDDVTEYLYPG